MLDFIVQSFQFVAGLFHLSPEVLGAALGAALAISEALALIPMLKSNSILQLVINVLKKALGKA